MRVRQVAAQNVSNVYYVYPVKCEILGSYTTGKYGLGDLYTTLVNAFNME